MSLTVTPTLCGRMLDGEKGLLISLTPLTLTTDRLEKLHRESFHKWKGQFNIEEPHVKYMHRGNSHSWSTSFILVYTVVMESICIITSHVASLLHQSTLLCKGRWYFILSTYPHISVLSAPSSQFVPSEDVNLKKKTHVPNTSATNQPVCPFPKCYKNITTEIWRKQTWLALEIWH